MQPAHFLAAHTNERMYSAPLTGSQCSPNSKRRYPRNGSLRAFTKAHAKRAFIRAEIADKSGGGKVISSRPELLGHVYHDQAALIDLATAP